MLIEVHKERLRELSARILLKKTDTPFSHQGSGVLYIDDQNDGYILTAAHVLKNFIDQEDHVFVECYSETKLPTNTFVAEEYLFCVKLEDVWFGYPGIVPDDGSFKDDDVAVIPLSKAKNPKRDWMSKRTKAHFLDKNAPLQGLDVMGFGYPQFLEKTATVSAWEPIADDVEFSIYDQNSRRIDWKMKSRQQEVERHGLSGGIVAQFAARNVVLSAVFQEAYDNNKGKRFIGTDIHKFAELFSGHHMAVRLSNFQEERETSMQLENISNKLRELERNNSACGTLGRELDPEVKDLMKDVLNKVLRIRLKKNAAFSGVDYIDTDAGCAVRIVASISGDDKVGQLLDAFSGNGQNMNGMRIIVLSLQQNVIVTQDWSRNGITLNRNDIWDASRLFRAIWDLEREKIAEINERLFLKKAVINQVKYPEHQLRKMPENSLYFNRKSRERELDKLKNKVGNPNDVKAVFISGVGGIGKTDLAIWLAKNWYPDHPQYFLKFMIPTPDEAKDGMDGMHKTILNAPFTNHDDRNHTPKENYDLKKKYIREEYSDAVLIVDDVDWPGIKLEEICRGDTYQELINSCAHVIFTTRSSTESRTGITVGSVDDDSLVKIIRSHRLGISDEQVIELSKLVDGHTLAVELMAKTVKNSLGRVDTESLRKLLQEGTDDVTKYPRVKRFYTHNSEIENKRLHEHLRGLFALESLTADQTKIMCCAMLIHKNGMPALSFAQIAETIECDAFNTVMDLEDWGWLIINRETNTICMDPMIAIVCRRVLKFDQDTCEKFLDGIWEYGKFLNTDSKERLALAECFAQAAAWGKNSPKAVQWKKQAEQILSEYTDWKQEVGL